MEQTDLAEDEPLKRVAVWTSINPELVAVQYQRLTQPIERVVSESVVTIDDDDSDDDIVVMSNDDGIYGTDYDDDGIDDQF